MCITSIPIFGRCNFTINICLLYLSRAVVLVSASILMVKSNDPGDVLMRWIPRISQPTFPDKCKIKIYENKTTVDCSNAGLKAIPRVPWNVTVLKLSGNTFHLIESKAFGFKPLLKTLYLDRCKITTIARLAFNGLPMLCTSQLNPREGGAGMGRG